MNYREVFIKAGKITWKYKALWIPAILLGIVTQFYSIGMAVFTGISSPALVAQNETSPSLLVGFMALFCVGALVVIGLAAYLRYASTIIISRGTCKVDQGTESLSFRELMGSVKTYFWQTFGLSLLLGLIGVAFILPFMCVAFFLVPSSLSNPENITSKLWVIYPFSILFGTLYTGFTEQALQALILENLDISAALSRGWRIYTHFWGTNVLMGFVLYLLNWGVTYLINLPQSLFTPFLQAVFLSVWPEILTTLLYAGLMVIYLLVYALIAGILATYVQSAWTLTFLRLTKPAQANAISDLLNA